MRRELTDSEFQSIKDRLDSLSLSYIEIYNELLDHYVTALEQVEPEEFADRKEMLDDEFGWSMVRGMEKQLLDSVSSQLQNSQLEALKFWKMDFWNVLGIFCYADFLILVYRFISLDVMFAFSFLPIFVVFVALLYHSGNYFSLTMDPKYHRPRNVILQAAFGRYALVYNFLNAFFFICYTFLNIHGVVLWTVLLLLLYSTVINLYALSLYGSINLKTFKLINL